MSATNIQAPEGMVPVLVQADVPYPYSIQRATYVAGWNACRAAVIAAAPVVVVDEGEVERLTHWLDCKYSRHREEEDKEAADLIRTLTAALKVSP